MSEPRTYESQANCPVARTLDVVGDRWTILVLRDLSWGRRRFGTLHESLRGISANLLSERLKRLEEHGMVERVFYNDHPPRAEYRLSAKGRAFIPVLLALREFGEAWEFGPGETPARPPIP
ncbi:MAG: helix-turn-helix transcriptional regulator [Dehalococcoidia bacterium]|nr:helix-turn-helix transcriptional regulator [Dehalococcoidia bacterium]